MAKILFVATDGGSYNALLPVVKFMSRKGHETTWVTQSAGVAAGKINGGYVIENNEQSIKNILIISNPDVVVSGVGSGRSDLCYHFSRTALGLGIQVVKVLDFWGTGMPHEKGFAPTRLCVLDAESITYEAKMRGMRQEHIVATGAPQFDALIDVSPLNISKVDRPFIVFIGPASKERVDEILLPLLELGKFLRAPISFGTLWHPRSKSETFVDNYAKIIHKMHNVHWIQDGPLRELGSGNALLASADLVIGATSTELVKACYLRRPTISFVPHNGVNHQLLLERGIDEMPTSACGATLHVGNQDSLNHLLRIFLKHGREWESELRKMLSAQEAFYRLDGKNTQRVCDVIESML